MLVKTDAFHSTDLPPVEVDVQWLREPGSGRLGSSGRQLRSRKFRLRTKLVNGTLMKRRKASLNDTIMRQQLLIARETGRLKRCLGIPSVLPEEKDARKILMEETGFSTDTTITSYQPDKNPELLSCASIGRIFCIGRQAF
jgi:hypothetical protein